MLSLFTEKKIIVEALTCNEDIQILMKKIINDVDGMEKSEVSNYLLKLSSSGISFFHYLYSPYPADLRYSIPPEVLAKNIFNFDLMMAEVHQVSLKRYHEWYSVFNNRKCRANKKNGERCRNNVYPPAHAKDFILIEHAYCKLHSSVSNNRL